MWLQYNEERFGYQGIENEAGFVLYTISPPNISIQELYIKPEFRGQKKAKEFVSAIHRLGEEAGCSRILAQIWLSDKGCNNMLAIALSQNFKLLDANNGRIIVEREI